MGRKNRSTRNRESSKRQSRNQSVRGEQARYVNEEYYEVQELLAGDDLLPRWWSRRDSYQKNYADSIDRYKMVLVDEKAGTSKTTIAVAKGLELLKAGEVDYIHYVRFPDKRALSLGFEPGNNKEKEHGYMFPFYEAMNECGVQDE